MESSDVDSDPRGKGFELIIRKLGGFRNNSTVLPAGTITAIIEDAHYSLSPLITD